VAVGGAVERAVMKYDRLAFRGQYDVDLDRRRTPGLGCLECRQRVLWVVKAVTPVAARMDAPVLARHETEGYKHAGSSFRAGPLVGRREYNAACPCLRFREGGSAPVQAGP
jgi:hypothetical protein